MIDFNEKKHWKQQLGIVVILGIIIVSFFIITAAAKKGAWNNIGNQSVRDGSSTLEKRKDKKNYLALGDSISVGTGLLDKSQGFTYLLADSLKYGNYYNQAVNGYTSNDLLKQLNDEKIRKEVRAADVITITIGGNDLIQMADKLLEFVQVKEGVNLEELRDNLSKVQTFFLIESATDNQKAQRYLEQSIENFHKNIVEITRMIHELNKDAVIVLQTVYNPLDGLKGFEMFTKFADIYVQRLNDILKEESVENYILVDVYKAFRGNAEEYTNINSFDVHPSEMGHHKIYELVYYAILGDEVSVMIYQ